MRLHDALEDPDELSSNDDVMSSDIEIEAEIQDKTENIEEGMVCHQV